MLSQEMITTLAGDRSQLSLTIIDEPEGSGNDRKAGAMRFDQLSPELSVEIYSFDVKDGKRGICVLTRVGKVKRIA